MQAKLSVPPWVAETYRRWSAYPAAHHWIMVRPATGKRRTLYIPTAVSKHTKCREFTLPRYRRPEDVKWWWFVVFLLLGWGFVTWMWA